MKIIFYIISILVLTTQPVSIIYAKAKVERSSICEPRVPKINYIQAVEIAQKVSKKYYRVGNAFIDMIQLSCENNEHFWLVGFRRKAYESGQLLVYIYMNGKTKTSIKKDG